MKKIEITYNIEDFENITNIMEFYDKINLTPMFGKEIKKVSQIKMNLENNEKLLSFFIKNRPKNKLKKNWDISVQLDWVNYKETINNKKVVFFIIFYYIKFRKEGFLF